MTNKDRIGFGPMAREEAERRTLQAIMRDAENTSARVWGLAYPPRDAAVRFAIFDLAARDTMQLSNASQTSV